MSAGSFSFAGRVTPACLDTSSASAEVNRFEATPPDAARFSGLFERLHDVSYAQAVQGDMKEAQAGMAAILDELGLDVEVPELRADMTEEDAAAAAAQLADELRRAEESRDAAKQKPRHEKTARAAEERASGEKFLRGPFFRDLVEALQLSEEERAALAGELIGSLEVEVDADAEASWSEEIRRRLDQVDSGVAKSISWAEARRRLHAAAGRDEKA